MPTDKEIELRKQAAELLIEEHAHSVELGFIKGVEKSIEEVTHLNGLDRTERQYILSALESLKEKK